MKIKIDHSNTGATISDRKFLRPKKAMRYVVLTSLVVIVFFAIVGFLHYVIYSLPNLNFIEAILHALFYCLIGLVSALLLSIGYLSFHLFGWIYWRSIDLDVRRNSLKVVYMFLGQKLKTKTISDSFDLSRLQLQQMGYGRGQRLVLRYHSYKPESLLVLTEIEDIQSINELIKGLHLRPS